MVKRKIYLTNEDRDFLVKVIKSYIRWNRSNCIYSYEYKIGHIVESSDIFKPIFLRKLTSLGLTIDQFEIELKKGELNELQKMQQTC
jgi:hypothetical protein